MISPSNYIAHENRIYCKHHHNQLFKEKGNFSKLDSLQDEDIHDNGSGPENRTHNDETGKDTTKTEPAGHDAKENGDHKGDENGNTLH